MQVVCRVGAVLFHYNRQPHLCKIDDTPSSTPIDGLDEGLQSIFPVSDNFDWRGCGGWVKCR